MRKQRKLNGKVKKARVQITICPTCKGNGYLKLQQRHKTQYISVGIVTQEEKFMKRLLMVLSMMVLQQTLK